MDDNGSTAIVIRAVERDVLEEFRRGAKARNITQAELLARLVALHREARQSPSRAVRKMLADLDLAQVVA